MLEIRRSIRLGKSLNRSFNHSAKRWAKPLSKQSLHHAPHVIEELQENPAPENYREYLRLKLRMATQKPPAEVQKNTFSNDR